MAGCQFGIHDLSRTALDKRSRLPRFNMPLELGMFLGMKYAGNQSQRKKRCLILDTVPYRYQQFCSDIAGQDIKAHKDQSAALIAGIRNWLRTTLDERGIRVPGARQILVRYAHFQRELGALCAPFHLDANDLTFSDFSALATGWLQATIEA